MEWVDCDDSLFRAYSLTNHPTHGDVFETFSVDAQASVVVQYFECPPNVTGAELENANIVLKLQNARCLPVNRIVWTDRRAVGAASETIYGFVVFYVDPNFPNPKQLSDEDVASYGRGNIAAIYFETLAFFHNFGICQLQLTNRSFVVMGSSILFADATQVVLALCHGVQNGDGSLPAARKADLLNDATFRPPPELFAVDTSPQAQLAPSHTNEEAAVNTESHSSASHQTFLERKELALAGLLVGDTWALESRDVWSAATSLLICFARIFYSDQDGTRVHLFDIGPDGGATEYCNIVSKQPRDFEVRKRGCVTEMSIMPRDVRSNDYTMNVVNELCAADFGMVLYLASSCARPVLPPLVARSIAASNSITSTRCTKN